MEVEERREKARELEIEAKWLGPTPVPLSLIYLFVSFSNYCICILSFVHALSKNITKNAAFAYNKSADS